MAPPPPPPELINDAAAEVLLRLPPDEPAHLFRAALVCKPWLRILTDPAFLRRYRAFHGTPPLLGLLHRLHPFQGDPAPLFFPTAAGPAFEHPASSRRRPRPLDCRHGRVLIDMLDGRTKNFLVWDPVTGDQHRFGEPDIRYFAYSAAVICAAAGCDHLDCHGGPFRVALVASDHSRDLIWASVYSSETRSWSTPTSLDNGPVFYVNAMRGALIGDEIYFTLKHGEGIAKYDWGKNFLSVVNPPPPEHYSGMVALMVMEDGSLGYAGIEDSSLYLWSRKVNAEGAAEWVQCRVIKQETVVPMCKPPVAACVVGFAEGVDVIFVGTVFGLFTIELKSGRVRKVDEPMACYSILPYMSFYTPDHGRLSSLVRTH
ncbi:hypothetical protein ACP70R_014559 [Stipagrostis hirtigluma subsp. patula]